MHSVHWKRANCKLMLSRASTMSSCQKGRRHPRKTYPREKAASGRICLTLQTRPDRRSLSSLSTGRPEWAHGRRDPEDT